MINNKKIKVLAYCDAPTCATGFSTVSRNIFEALYSTGRYDIDILGINYWGDPHNFPYRIWPTGTNPDRDPYGRKKICSMIPRMDYDLLFFLQDTFILDFLPELIPYLKSNKKNVKSICYFPIDGIPKQKWIRNISVVDKLVAYSQYGKNMAIQQWPGCNDVVKNAMVIPHGVNLKDYTILPESDIKAFRERYFGINKDKFIIMNLNRNQQRKDIPRTIQAFAEFRKQVPNSLLYLHMAQKDQGWDLVEVCNSFGFDTVNDIVFPENFGPNQGYPRQVVNMLYNVSDCVVSTSLGEGFGLCLAPNTNMYTEVGVKPLSELNITDKVLGSNGDYNKVEGIMSRQYDEDLYSITTWLSNIPIRSSAEHGFKVFEDDDYIWKKAKDLRVGDNLVFPRIYNSIEDEITLNVLDIIKPHLSKRQLKNIITSNDTFKIQSNFKKEENSIPLTFDLTPDFCRLLGYYLAEGSLSSSKMDSVSFSFNKKEIEHIEFVAKTIKNTFGLDAYYHPHTNRLNYNGQTITFYSSALAYLFKYLCGKGARTKKISSLLLKLNKQCLTELLYGLYIGDGSYSSKYYEVSFSTVSVDIAYQIRLLLARLGILSSVRTSRVEYKINVSGKSRELLFELFDLTNPTVDRTLAHERAFTTNAYLIFPIKSIDKEHYTGTLVDIQVANTNDFVAENVVVHNSWLEAMATKTPVIMPDNTMFGEFITKDTGWLVKSGNNPSLYTVLPHDNEVSRPLVDVDDMVAQMYDVYSNVDERNRRVDNAYKWVTTKMDWQGPIAKQWIDLFDSVYRDTETDVAKNRSIEQPNEAIKTEVF